MFLQGNLEKIFEALHDVGAVETMLKLDWEPLNEEVQRTPEVLRALVEVVNGCHSDPIKLRQVLARWDRQSLNYLALEVAREYAEYQDRKTLH